MDQATIDSINHRLDMLEENLDRLLRRVEECTHDIPRLVRMHKIKFDHYCMHCKRHVYSDYPGLRWNDYQDCCMDCAVELD